MEVPSIKHILNNCLIFSVISTTVIAQITQIPQRYTSKNPCTSKGTCHECIQTPSCAWCFDPEYTENPRCFQPSTTEQPNAMCDEKFVLNPDNVMSILENLALSEVHGASGGGGGTLVGGYEGSYSESESWSRNESSSWSAGDSAKGGFRGGRPIRASGAAAAQPKAKGDGVLSRRGIGVRILDLTDRLDGQSYSIHMTYKQAQDYPLDLYYLMDLSSSMHDDKDNLSRLGNKLAETMRRLTSNFRLGFGSFVDKVVMPYVSTLQQKLQRPCDICVAPYGFRHHMTLSNNTHMFSNLLCGYSLEHPCDGCAAPYGFKNAMKLSTNVVRFSTEVQNANVSGNLDAPEGGFDAIMQAVVCRDQIGWRDKARRLLVFSTDASFHYAGDGKLGGIVKPNDGECHMSEDGQNSINVIFAVTKETIKIYEELAKRIEGASVGKLEGDSSNIVELIKEQYKKISSTVELKHNASSAVKLRFFSRCLNKTGAEVETKKCGDIKNLLNCVFYRFGDSIKFRIDIEILKCPKDPKDYFQTIKISPVAINESLIIDLQMLCDCECERPGNTHYRINSPFCSNSGTYRCGVCDCNPGAFGPKCQCTAEGDTKNITMNCIQPGTSIECSGRGECTCGHCICKTRSNSLESMQNEHSWKEVTHRGWKRVQRMERGKNENAQVLIYARIGFFYVSVLLRPTCRSLNCCQNLMNSELGFWRVDGELLNPHRSDLGGIRTIHIGYRNFLKSQVHSSTTSLERKWLQKKESMGNIVNVITSHASVIMEKVCSDHGSCDCGLCVCDPGWTGPNCACRDTNDTCKPFGLQEDILCSGNGICDCGACVCNVTSEGRYSGKFCEKCPTCPDRCNDFKDCVQCQQYKTGKLKGDECAAICEQKFVPIGVKEVIADEENGEVMCHFEDEDGCRFRFVYYYDETQKLQVRAQEERECPDVVHIPAIILGVIAAVVLIGMAILLLWKLLTTIHDRREFARFEKEKMMAKWDTGENPIYKQATSTFKKSYLCRERIKPHTAL
ncbi:hypothetical protein NQ318_007577 [Aromia moschata]|uniref:Integrin beta n=1 Tax=Aromia moschata TaxID=1265417 RepID=A0AAV8YDG0_9CUCU|nr:hypothetical protein NQ318_007577 [Aromia moschata]